MTIILTFYDQISEGLAGQVIEQLRAQPSADVTVYLNSPGGSVSEGLAIFNALRSRNTTVYIDGVAASIASVIAMAGQRVCAAQNSLLMIHDPWCEAGGNAAEMRRTADILDKHRDAMVGAYTRSGLPLARLVEMLAAETWMTADEALALGFIDEITEPLRVAAHAPHCFADYHKTPKELLSMPNPTSRRAEAAPPPAPPSTPPTPEEQDKGKTLEAFRKGLNSDSVITAAHDAVMDALQERNEAIAAMAEPHLGNSRIRSMLVTAMANPRLTTGDFGNAVLAELARGREPLGNYGQAFSGESYGTSSKDFVAAASDALLIRGGFRVDKAHPGARDVVGMSMEQIMRTCATRAGQDVGFGGNTRSMVKAAMTTSDFPAILENSLGKALRIGYESEPATFDPWTRKVLVPDFKEQSRVTLGSAPDLKPVPEGGEYTYGSIEEDRSLPYRVEKFGRVVKLTWEALVNDDLDAFLRLTQAMGQAAFRAEADAVYNTFLENGGAGPVMQDGVTLFHANHGNVATAATGVNADSLAAARVLLRRMTAVGGGVMNLAPRFLLVSPEFEQQAEILLASASRGMSQGAGNVLVPSWLAGLELVVEARLTEDAFYLLAAPTSVDTMERGWLEEDNGPVIEEQTDFNTDARSYKVRHVFGNRWLDWRGAVKVPVS